MKTRVVSVLSYFVPFVLSLVLAADLGAQTLRPDLLADIDPRFFSEGSFPRSFVAVGDRVVFMAGDHLWSSTGVPGETLRLTPEDISIRSLEPLVGVGRLAYFAACRNGCGVWRTDGTPEGTFPLASVQIFGNAGIAAIAPVGSPWTFVTVDNGSLSTLWRTNGTPNGTRQFPSFLSRVRELTFFKGRLFFFADAQGVEGGLFSLGGPSESAIRVGSSSGGRGLISLAGRLLYLSGPELWASDGTSAGTRRLLREGRGSLLVTAGSRAYFFDDVGDLWVTDGTSTGTKKLRSRVNPRSALLALGSRVAFTAFDSASGVELWTTDGTTAGTRLVKDVCPGPCSGADRLGISGLGRIWFQGLTPTRGAEIWTSDLTAQGTRLVSDLCRGVCSSSPESWIQSGSRLYLTVRGADGQRRLARSDGTPSGTFTVSAGGQDQNLSGVAFGAGSLLFAGCDPEHGTEPWRSDGTRAGTFRVDDIEADNAVGSKPTRFATAGGLGFFFADDGVHGEELWASDGTTVGTRLAFDVEPGPFSSFTADLKTSSADGRLIVFFPSRHFLDGFDLYGSDGSPTGSGPLLPAEVFADGRHLRAGNRLYFVGRDDAHGSELWATDGTGLGTVRLTDFVSPDPFRSESAEPSLLALGDRVVAPVLLPSGEEELWISDGTVGGTRRLAEVYPFLEAPLAGAGAQFLARGGVLYFVSTAEGDETAALWRTNLTAGGTSAVKSLDLSTPSFRRWMLFNLPEKILIFGDSPSFGSTLWSSDGTASETRVVGRVEMSDVPPIVFGNRLWFSGGFREVWSTDGTASGTNAFRSPSGASFEINKLGVLGDRLVFVGRRDLTETDGTPEGTSRIELDGALAPLFLDAAFFDGKALFNWRDGIHGEELWTLSAE